MIEINEVTKILGDREVLKNITLGVTKGTIFGLIGENGAGKTTLIKCLTGIYLPDQGRVRIGEQEVFDNPAVKARIGYVADQNHCFPGMKVKELIRFYRLSYSSFSEERFQSLNQVFQLDLNKRLKQLSKGMKMRLALGLNLSIQPEVLVLDEPTSGLDPIVKREVTNLLLQEVEERDTTIFISSHHLSDLERICDNIAIIQEGQIQYVNSLEGMKRNIKKLQVVFQEEPPQDLKDWPEVLAMEKLGRVHYLITKEYSREFEEKLKGCRLMFLEEVDLSLEDMFIYAAGEGLKNGKVLV
ncbi:MAG: ABC transporter ATP-binding protein [Clostridia bacterium]|jgi:ABC-2 type transport system ATP-binding protein|nr:ABC transporter ATP-binding protein [Clostridia bacterium]